LKKGEGNEGGERGMHKEEDGNRTREKINNEEEMK
jgi:hypothetical protein